MDREFALMEIHDRELYERYKPLLVSVPCGERGLWKVDRFKTKIDLGYLRFWRDGRSPGLGRFTRLLHKERGVVMSDTVPEINDLGRYITKLQGNVLVTGLGLGMAIHMMLSGKLDKVTPKIKSVTVIELEKDVIKLTGGYYEKKYPGQVTIVNADARTWVPKEGTKFDSAWHDIWDMMNNHDDARALKERYAPFVRGRMQRQYYWGQHEAKERRYG